MENNELGDFLETLSAMSRRLRAVLAPMTDMSGVTGDAGDDEDDGTSTTPVQLPSLATSAQDGPVEGIAGNDEEGAPLWDAVPVTGDSSPDPRDAGIGRMEAGAMGNEAPAPLIAAGAAIGLSSASRPDEDLGIDADEGTVASWRSLAQRLRMREEEDGKEVSFAWNGVAEGQDRRDDGEAGALINGGINGGFVPASNNSAPQTSAVMAPLASSLVPSSAVMGASALAPRAVLSPSASAIGAPPAAAPVSIQQTTEIHVHGGGDSSATAREIAEAQGGVNAQLQRNLQGILR